MVIFLTNDSNARKIRRSKECRWMFGITNELSIVPQDNGRGHKIRSVDSCGKNRVRSLVRLTQLGNTQARGLL